MYRSIRRTVVGPTTAPTPASFRRLSWNRSSPRSVSGSVRAAGSPLSQTSVTDSPAITCSKRFVSW